MSIAVHGDLVYVLNAGVTPVTVPGRQLRSRASGLLATTSGQTPAQTARSARRSPPPLLPRLAGMVGFSPDGARLVVATKFSGSLLDVFSVGRWGMLSATQVANPTAPTRRPRDLAFTDPWGRLVAVRSALGHQQLRLQARQQPCLHQLG